MLGLVSPLPGEVDDNITVIAFARIDCDNCIFPASSRWLELGRSRTQRGSCSRGVALTLPTPLRSSIGLTTGTGSAALLSLLTVCRLSLLLLPSSQNRFFASDRLQVSFEDLRGGFPKEKNIVSWEIVARGGMDITSSPLSPTFSPISSRSPAISPRIAKLQSALRLAFRSTNYQLAHIFVHEMVRNGLHGVSARSSIM